VRNTIDAVARHFTAGGPLFYRYPPGRDHLPGTEGAFPPCSFWLVQALAATVSTAEASRLFDELSALASPLGLYAHIDAATNRRLGNYPQALTHAPFLQAALSLHDS
jgi:GH15 family glucan-1,4-alpha-glucosidase